MSVVSFAFFGGGGGRACMRESQNLEALCSIQFLASFISLYFNILSFLACGEKIIRLASKHQLAISISLTDVLQETFSC